MDIFRNNALDLTCNHCHFFVTLKTTHGKKKISLVAFDTSRV